MRAVAEAGGVTIHGMEVPGTLFAIVRQLAPLSRLTWTSTPRMPAPLVHSIVCVLASCPRESFEARTACGQISPPFGSMSVICIGRPATRRDRGSKAWRTRLVEGELRCARPQEVPGEEAPRVEGSERRGAAKSPPRSPWRSRTASALSLVQARSRIPFWS
jgi:hypothetical protein